MDYEGRIKEKVLDALEEETTCCMCNQEGNFPSLNDLRKENIYQLNNLKSQGQAKLLLKMGFELEDKFCSDCFWK